MIDIKKNPEAVGKLKVGTSAATPADGELLVSGNVGVGDSTPSSPGGAARFVEISGTSASLVLTDSDAATWEWISAGGNLKAAKDGSDYLSIDSSGNVNVDGGGYVKIAPADTQAELRLYRDDATINTSGIAIGDINFGGADADNDNAARLRVKSDGAWTGSSSPTAFEFQTCPSGSESPQTRLVIGSTGDVTVNESVAIGTSPTAGISLNVRENSTTTAADIRNANASGFGLYVAGGSSSSQYAFRAADKDNTALFTVKGDGLAEFANDVAFDDHARVYHGNLPNTGPGYSSHDKYNFNFTFSGTYGVALITLDIAAGIGEVAAGRYTLAVSCTANSGVTTQLMGSVTEVFLHNLSALTFADSGSSNRTFTLSVERTVTAENWGPNANYKLEVTNNHQTLTLNSVTAST
jgi:hypothetical protein